MRLLNTIVTLATLATFITLLQACSPTLNWRDVRFEDKDGNPMNEAHPLQALLPCKPDRASRAQTLAGMTVELSLMGCVAGDTTFTVGRISLKNVATVSQVLTAWQTATWANVGYDKATVPADQPFKMADASATPSAVKIEVAGRVASAQTAWFVKQDGAEAVLYQAMMIVPAKQAAGMASQAEASSTFFEGLKF